MMGRFGDGDDHYHIATMTDVRYPRFIMCQFFQSTVVYFLCRTLISPFAPLTTAPDAAYAFCKTLISPFAPSNTLPDAVYDFLLFQNSFLMFSTSLFLVFSPPPVRRLSPTNFLLGLLKLIFVNGDNPLTFNYRRRVRVTLNLVIFLAFSGMSTSVAVVCISGSHSFGSLGLRGFVVGLMYASHYRRWVLDFPIVQEGLYFLYKLSVPKAVIKAVKLSSKGYLLTLVLSIFTNFYKGQLATGDLIMEQIVFYLACAVVFLCWELNRNLLQVIFTQRLIFAPPRESLAALTNASDILLATLEDTTSVHHVRYLAYYDLCMVSESNVDTRRRAALYGETGETYIKVIDLCLRPLKQLILDLSSNHLHSSTELSSSRLNEPFFEFQILAWCARIVSSLTVGFKKEGPYQAVRLFDRFRASTISDLLSSLLAVEASMGKKTQLPSTNNYPNPRYDNFRLAAMRSTTRRGTATALYKKNSPHYSKAYSLADILRTSIYQFVSLFHQEMVFSSEVGRLQKDWITLQEPLYGSRELLVHKLRMFLEFQAN